MKLKNKKTGEIGRLSVYTDGHVSVDDVVSPWPENTIKSYNSLAELNEEWEDYEEPDKYWFIDPEGEAVSISAEYNSPEGIKACKQIGNYFDTREEAEKAVENLKAWKRLKDKGIVIRKLRHNENGGDMYWSCPNKTGISDKQIWLDLDLLFGGEE